MTSETIVMILVTAINVEVGAFVLRFNTYMKKKGENQATIIKIE